MKKWYFKGLYIFMIIMLLILIFTLIDSFKFSAKRQEKIERFLNIQNPKKITLKTNNEHKVLNKSTMNKFLNELQKDRITPHHSRPIRKNKVYIEIRLTNEKSLLYSIAPDSDAKGEFWVFSENNEDVSNDRVNLIKSKWLLDFLKQNNFIKYAK